MLFHSMDFGVFFVAVFTLYWLIPNRYRWGLLLLSSYYFYMSWNAKLLILIVLITAVSYSAGIGLEKSAGYPALRKEILTAAVVICLGVLAFFKYLNFFADIAADLVSCFTSKPFALSFQIIVPVGISFYTFQALSYVIDIYRGKIDAEKHPGIYAAYISFFPQLVAGPIERADHLLPQLRSDITFDYDQAIEGVELLLLGYFKKLVIADVASQYVDLVYGNLYSYRGLDLVLISIFFSLQIYCDFSGYSDIARGLAKLLGIELMVNFNGPYFASSVKEFWSEWHVSLSKWFREYVYIPLGGNRCSIARNYFNLLVTFLVSGLWHGANWTFVVWGGIHGVVHIVEKCLERSLKEIRKKRMGRVLLTLIVFVICDLAWVFFRANSCAEACYVLKNMFCVLETPKNYFVLHIEMGVLRFASICFSIAVLSICDYLNRQGKLFELLKKQNPFVRWGFAVFLGLMIVFLSQKGEAAEFVYFQF